MPEYHIRVQHSSQRIKSIIIDLVDDSEQGLFAKLDRCAEYNGIDYADIVSVLKDQGFTDLSDSYETYLNDNE